MRVSPLALNVPGRKDLRKPIDAYQVPEPAPGVLPKGVTAAMAMDQAFPDQLWGWAAQSYWAEGLGFMGYAYLSELTQRPEYRKGAEIIAKEMTRKWIKLTATSVKDKKGEEPEGAEDADPAEEDKPKKDDKTKKLKAIEDEFKRLGIQALFRRAAEHDGFFGRGQIFIDACDLDDDDELKTELTPRKIKMGKGQLRGMRVIEPIWTYPSVYNASQPLRDDYYKPKNWYVLGKEVHSSRLLTFISREVPDILKPAYMFGGLSLSQMAKPYVDNWLRTRQSVSDLVAAFSVMVLKTDMKQVLSNGGNTNLNNRVELFNQYRSNSGAMVVDKDKEDLTNVSAPISGLDKLQAQSQEQMAAVYGTPLVVLLGITPEGLNTSTDGEIRTFYAWCRAMQEQLFDPNLTIVLKIVQLHLFGEVDPEIGYTWVPLWELDEKSLADKRKVEADTDNVHVEMGAIDPAEVRKRLAAEDDGPYADIDPDDVPEPPEEPGMEGEMAGEPGSKLPPGAQPPKPTKPPATPGEAVTSDPAEKAARADQRAAA